MLIGNTNQLDSDLISFIAFKKPVEDYFWIAVRLFLDSRYDDSVK